jgi:hypothetical protein
LVWVGPFMMTMYATVGWTAGRRSSQLRRQRGRGELAHWDHVLQLYPVDWVQAVRWRGDRGPGM